MKIFLLWIFLFVQFLEASAQVLVNNFGRSQVIYSATSNLIASGFKIQNIDTQSVNISSITVQLKGELAPFISKLFLYDNSGNEIGKSPQQSGNEFTFMTNVDLPALEILSVGIHCDCYIIFHSDSFIGKGVNFSIRASVVRSKSHDSIKTNLLSLKNVWWKYPPANEEVIIGKFNPDSGSFICKGDTVTLRFEVFNATSIKLNENIYYPSPGKMDAILKVSPMQSTSYSLTAYGVAGDNIDYIVYVDVADCHTSGITHRNPELVNIFPNPIIDQIFISGINPQQKVSISDIFGNIVYQNLFSSSVGEIQCGEFKKGIYFLKVGKTVFKLVKE